MTLHEAIGIKNANIDAKTGETVSHSEIYGHRAVDFLGGMNAVIPFIPFTREQVQRALKNDKWLNNLSMTRWDAASGFTTRPNSGVCIQNGGGISVLYRAKGINAYSCSDGVCLLKEAARRWAEEE